jgi:hypothetical protein
MPVLSDVARMQARNFKVVHLRLEPQLGTNTKIRLSHLRARDQSVFNIDA